MQLFHWQHATMCLSNTRGSVLARRRPRLHREQHRVRERPQAVQLALIRVSKYSSTAAPLPLQPALSHPLCLQFVVADAVAHLQASRFMVRGAAALLQQGSRDATVASAMAKRFATNKVKPSGAPPNASSKQLHPSCSSLPLLLPPLPPVLRHHQQLPAGAPNIATINP